MALRWVQQMRYFLPFSVSLPPVALAAPFPQAPPSHPGSWVWFPDGLVGIYILFCIDDLIHPFGPFSVENQAEYFPDQICFSRN